MATTETILEATIKAGVEHFGGFPPGSMIAFAGKAIPEGWLLCNGALVSRTTYARLFAAIGTAWGAGDGSTTFKLPDADGRVMQGATDASKVGQYLEAGLPNITGEYSPRSGMGALSSKEGLFWGAFSKGVKSSDAAQIGLVSGDASYRLYLNAGDSSPIYSRNSSVQMPAFQTLIIIKI